MDSTRSALSPRLSIRSPNFLNKFYTVSLQTTYYRDDEIYHDYLGSFASIDDAGKFCVSILAPKQELIVREYTTIPSTSPLAEEITPSIITCPVVTYYFKNKMLETRKHEVVWCGDNCDLTQIKELQSEIKKMRVKNEMFITSIKSLHNWYAATKSSKFSRGNYFNKYYLEQFHCKEDIGPLSRLQKEFQFYKDQYEFLNEWINAECVLYGYVDPKETLLELKGTEYDVKFKFPPVVNNV